VEKYISDGAIDTRFVFTLQKQNNSGTGWYNYSLTALLNGGKVEFVPASAGSVLSGSQFSLSSGGAVSIDGLGLGRYRVVEHDPSTTQLGYGVPYSGATGPGVAFPPPDWAKSWSAEAVVFENYPVDNGEPPAALAFVNVPGAPKTPPPVDPGDTDPPDPPPPPPEEEVPPVPPAPPEGGGGAPGDPAAPTSPPPPVILGDDGVPLGEWRWDPDTGTWVFDEFPPLANMELPQTGERLGPLAGPLGEVGLMLATLIAAIAALALRFGPRPARAAQAQKWRQR
jgi:hypothetical protein